MRQRGPWLAALAVASSLLIGSAARSQVESEPTLLASKALAAMQSGEPAAAIARYEALADRGESNAAWSFDRGLAYALRVRLGGEVQGDLGQAAHGFEEAEALAPSSPLAKQARSAAALIRSEVARRRAREGAPAELDTARSFREAIIALLPENAWASLAFLGSLATAVGLVVFLRNKAARARVAGGIAMSVGSLLLVACTTMTAAARDERLHTREAVVVVPTARLANDSHLVLPQAPALPEAARIRILETSGSWARLRWGAVEGWLPTSSLRLLATDAAR